jgi:hypothetical protein
MPIICTVIEMVNIIREELVEANRFGNSDYLLLDATMKEMLSQILKQPFDREKHKLKTQLSVNKDGQIFVAFWFVDEKQEKKKHDAKDILEG